MQFSQLRLLVDDFAGMYRFYRDVLGLTPGFGGEHDVYADFNLGEDHTLALFGRSEMLAAIGAPQRGAAEQNRLVLAFEVDDLDGAIAGLEAKGVALLAPATDRPDWGLRTIHLRDPEGNLLEIFVRIPMS